MLLISSPLIAFVCLTFPYCKGCVMLESYSELCFILVPVIGLANDIGAAT